MKILHTSDWHIGKKLEGRSRMAEQTAVLNEIVEICDREEIQLVLVAGDVYDVYTPPAEAERLFYDVVSRLAGEKRIVIVISGNHDDGVRLCASAPIALRKSVYFADNPCKDFSGEYLASGIRMEKVGDGYFVVGDKDGDRAYVATLSYPTELRLKEKTNDAESYSDKVASWIRAALSENNEGLPEILVSHLFTLGGESGEGERNIELGGARILNPSVIPDSVCYTALGHLHKRQIVNSERNIIYCGSPMRFFFDEAEMDKSVTSFVLRDGKISKITLHKLKNAVNLHRLNATSLAEGREILQGVDGLVELTLSIGEPLDPVEHKKFLADFPNVFLRLRFVGETTFTSERREMGAEELFAEYYKSRFGGEVPKQLMELFLKFLNQAEEEN